MAIQLVAWILKIQKQITKQRLGQYSNISILSVYDNMKGIN